LSFLLSPLGGADYIRLYWQTQYNSGKKKKGRYLGGEDGEGVAGA